MNTDKEKTNNPLDVRIIIAMLWVAGMLSSLNGDTYRLSDSAVLRTLLEKTSSIVATPGLLLIMSLIFVIPVFMGFLTLTLKPAVSRLTNRIIGVIYALIHLANFVASLKVQTTGYGVVWSTAGLVLSLLVVWYAWKWRK